MSAALGRGDLDGTNHSYDMVKQFYLIMLKYIHDWAKSSVFVPKSDKFVICCVFLKFIFQIGSDILPGRIPDAHWLN